MSPAEFAHGVAQWKWARACRNWAGCLYGFGVFDVGREGTTAVAQDLEKKKDYVHIP